jgi:hypothetical protein
MLLSTGTGHNCANIYVVLYILSSNKDVAALVPGKNLTAKNLKLYTLQVMDMLENVAILCSV